MTKVGKKKRGYKYSYRATTYRDEVRALWKEAGILEYLPPLRHRDSEAKRVLTALGIDNRIANYLTAEEQLDLTADLSAIGIMPGRTSFTRPERLAISYLLKAGYSYGGDGYNFNPNSDFGTQISLNGGKSGASNSGTNVDIFITPHASVDSKGTLVFIDGVYIHSRNDIATRDAATELVLKSEGWSIMRITDVETESNSMLDSKFKSILLPK